MQLIELRASVFTSQASWILAGFACTGAPVVFGRLHGPGDAASLPLLLRNPVSHAANPDAM